jgi:hypothetical protein
MSNNFRKKNINESKKNLRSFKYFFTNSRIFKAIYQMQFSDGNVRTVGTLA